MGQIKGRVLKREKDFSRKHCGNSCFLPELRRTFADDASVSMTLLLVGYIGLSIKVFTNIEIQG